jgi:hypothetical protein
MRARPPARARRMDGRTLERVPSHLPGRSVLWIVVWTLVLWLNAGANLATAGSPPPYGFKVIVTSSLGSIAPAAITLSLASGPGSVSGTSATLN